jgi:hypothetical protein
LAVVLPLPIGERVGVRRFLPEERPYALTRLGSSILATLSPREREKKRRLAV